MPIYEFVCTECRTITDQYCGSVEEVEEVWAGKKRPTCKKCGSKNTERVMSVVNGVVNGYNERNGYAKK